MFKALEIPDNCKVDLDISIDDIRENASHMEIKLNILENYINSLNISYQIKSMGELKVGSAVDDRELLFINLKVSNVENAIFIANNIFKMFPYLIVICLELGDYQCMAVADIRKNKKDSSLNVVDMMRFSEWIKRDHFMEIEGININYSSNARSIYNKIKSYYCNKFEYRKIPDFYRDEKFLTYEIIASANKELVDYKIEKHLIEKNIMLEILVEGLKSVFGLSYTYGGILDILNHDSAKEARKINGYYRNNTFSNIIYSDCFMIKNSTQNIMENFSFLKYHCQHDDDTKPEEGIYLINKIKNELSILKTTSLQSINHGHVDLIEIEEIREILVFYINDNMLEEIMYEMYENRFEIHDQKLSGYIYCTSY